MSKKVLVSFFLMVLVVAGFFLLVDEDAPVSKSQLPESNTDDVKTTTLSIVASVSLPAAAGKQAQEQFAEETTKKEPAEINTVDTSLFEFSNHASTAEFSNPAFREHGQPITIDSDKLSALKVGESLVLPFASQSAMTLQGLVPQGNSRSMMMFAVPDMPPGAESVLAVDKSGYVFGSIATPAGVYVIEVIDGEGWVVDAQYMDEGAGNPVEVAE